MKKLLLIALLMLALVVTAVACTGDPATNETTAGTTAGETPTEAPETPTEAPETPTEAPEVPTEAPETQAPEVPTEAPETQAPEVPTEAPETEPETEPETLDPMAPIGVYEAADISTVVGASADHLTQDCVTVMDNYIHVVPIGPDPYWYPFSNVKGARYVVVRYRTADATGANMQVYIGSSGAGPSDDTTMVQVPLTVDGEWHLAIIDTQPVIDTGKYDGSTVSYLRFDALESGYKLDENGEPYKEENDQWAR